MAAIKALIFGVDDLFPKLKPYYDREVERGNLEIIGYAIFEGNEINFVKNLSGEPLSNISFQKIIISSQNNFIPKFKLVKLAFQNFAGGGINLDNVIDGRIFKLPNFDLLQFCEQGTIQLNGLDSKKFHDSTNVIYQRIYKGKSSIVTLGVKSYVASSTIEGRGYIQIGDFSSLAWDIIFQLGLNNDHYCQNVSSYGIFRLDCVFQEFYKPDEAFGFLKIGSDVWIGRGCRFKSSNPNKPLLIGDGAVVAADSVVVKDVPPFAIVGGNPAKFIKWRFEPEIIEALQRIAWWNWDLEKIYDNFHLFKDPAEFVRMFDPQK